jgi:hypothetical protein
MRRNAGPLDRLHTDSLSRHAPGTAPALRGQMGLFSRKKRRDQEPPPSRARARACRSVNRRTVLQGPACHHRFRSQGQSQDRLTSVADRTSISSPSRLLEPSLTPFQVAGQRVGRATEVSLSMKCSSDPREALRSPSIRFPKLHYLGGSYTRICQTLPCYTSG